MIDDGIRDGDMVLVERRSNARDGEMVVAILPGEEATLKRLYRHPAGYRLQPANATMHASASARSPWRRSQMLMADTPGSARPGTGRA